MHYAFQNIDTSSENAKWRPEPTLKNGHTKTKVATTQIRMRKKGIQMMLVAVIVAFASCTTQNHSMREPNAKVNLTKSDFSLSEQVSAEATSTKILGIDFARLFMKKTGVVSGGASSISLASIPVIGNLVSDGTGNYALYELMNKNPGYDVVFYPQYETKVLKPILGIGLLTRITTVKTTARLGKLNK